MNRLKGLSKRKGANGRIPMLIIQTAIAAIILSGCGAAADSTEQDASDTVQEIAGVSGASEADAEAVVIEQTYYPTLLGGPEDTENLYVSAIDGLSDDFICGMDVSSLLAEEASGVKYYDTSGEEQDLFRILADAGVNCIRVRVWNDPYDADGRGYGGGNCTAETAAALGARAAAYGMDLCVDFHYSDFWADPNKQMRPKAWNNMRINDQKQALYDYTCDSLRTILDAGARVTMVQIGNEINYGLSGRTSFKDIAELLKYGSQAVRDISAEYGRDMAVTVHYTAIDDYDGIMRIADRLDEAEVDYDVFGVSYYPFWHGDMENLTAVLKSISSAHGVDTCVMETSYMYTVDDGDGSGNSVDGGNIVEGYPISIQGQATCVRDVCAAASEGGALGVFYWEGAWIPVPEPAGSARSSVWEEYGSGWASSYAAEYDPSDAGRYYGGCSWENQAFFDFEGHVLPSIDVFKYLKYGAKGTILEIIGKGEVTAYLLPGDEIALPDIYPFIFNNPDGEGMEVIWDAEAIAAIDTETVGTYHIPGTVELGAVSATEELKKTFTFDDDGLLVVDAEVNIENVNLVKNPSFEDADRSMWRVTALSGSDPSDYQDKSADAHDGKVAFHFWSQSDMEFNIEQEMTVEKAGTYCANAWMQGGDFNDDATIYLYVRTPDAEYSSDNVTLDGWVNWKNPSIDDINISAGDKVVIGAYVSCRAKAWATFDEFSLKMK